MDVRSIVKERLELLRETRRELHKIPELSGKEEKTQEFICDFLSDRRIRYKKIHTGVIADFEGKDDRKCIAFRADIDALPIQEKTGLPYESENGCMHACGHDGHTAMLLTLCDIFAKEDPPVNMRAIFQFGEEGAGGAEDMIAGGALKGVDEIYALHVDPSMPEGVFSVREGAMMAGTMEFTIRFTGKESHCAEPEKGINAFNPLIALLQAADTFTASHKDDTLFHIGKIAGGNARNIVAGNSEALCTIRYFEETQRGDVFGKIWDFLKEADEKFDTAHVVTMEEIYPPLENSPQAVARIKTALPEITEAPRRYTAEDFAFYTEEIPGALAWIGVKSESFSSPLHSDTFGFNEEALLYGVEYFLRLLN